MRFISIEGISSMRIFQGWKIVNYLKMLKEIILFKFDEWDTLLIRVYLIKYNCE